MIKKSISLLGKYLLKLSKNPWKRCQWITWPLWSLSLKIMVNFSFLLKKKLPKEHLKAIIQECMVQTMKIKIKIIKDSNPESYKILENQISEKRNLQGFNKTVKIFGQIDNFNKRIEIKIDKIEIIANKTEEVLLNLTKKWSKEKVQPISTQI